MDSRPPDITAGLSDRELAELAALADGSLPDKRRAGAQARVDASPEVAALVADQRRALEAVRSAAPSAPERLRLRVERERRRRAPVARRRGAALAAGRTAAAALASLIVVLVLPGGSPGAPSIVQAAALATRPPVQHAPAQYDHQPALLNIENAGIRFPDWKASFSWRAVGSRSDDFHGRRAVTVHYRWKDRQLAYTILSGSALSVPGAFARVVRNGVEIKSLVLGGRRIVTWRRAGHTCVITAQRVPLESLRELAAWKGGGAVEY